MPYYKTSPRKHKTLVDRLAKELSVPPQRLIGPVQAPKKSLMKKESRPPVIIQEEQRVSHRLHITVIWDAWASVPEEERGGVILDAYESALGAETTSRIGMAMGVTIEEAKTLGIFQG